MTTSNQVWDALQGKFSSTSRSRIALLKRQLQTITQGNKSCTNYLEEAKFLSDLLTAVGKKVDDQDLISYLISGLQTTFTPFITTFNMMTGEKEFTLHDFQAELLSFESLLDPQPRQAPDTHFAFGATKQKFSTAMKKPKPQTSFAEPQQYDNPYGRSSLATPSTNKQNNQQSDRLPVKFVEREAIQL